MEGKRKHSKGGFFHLFDWNRKSRKKLFVNNSDLPGPKKGKENVENMAKSQLHGREVDDRRANSSSKGSCDFSCSSSVSSDEGDGTRAPGVVARLMGLDSLPTANVAEPSSTPLFDSLSLRASQYDRSTPNLWSEYNLTDHLYPSNNQERCSWNSEESRPLKVRNLPIERFKTEILPPKTAKPIPITHHKLLSPIKSPGFIPAKNVAYIMEAAAKIIEASPKAINNGKVPSIGSSSVSLRIRDLKQKMEAAHKAPSPQRLNQPCGTKSVKGHHSDKVQGRSEGMSSSKASIFSEQGVSDRVRNKGKSISLAVQAKANVQRREGSTSRSDSVMKQKKQNEVKVNQSLNSQPHSQKTLQKRSSGSRTNSVLRQNNQKQNCVSNCNSSTVKILVSNVQDRKVQSTSSSSGPNKTINKVVVRPETFSRKMNSVVTDSEKEKTKNMLWNKQSVNGNLQIDGSVSEKLSFNKDCRSTKCDVKIDGHTNMATDNRKSGMDVVSFMFTSPMKAMPSSESSGQTMGKTHSFDIDSFGRKDYLCKNLMSSFPGLNVISGDALGVLLQQKLRELTDKVQSSHCNGIREETSASSTSNLQNSVPTFNMVNTSPAAQNGMFQLVDKDKSHYPDDFDCLLAEHSQLIMNQSGQQSEEIEDQSSSSKFSEPGRKLESQQPSPVSILEPSFANGSCSNSNGSKHCLPAQAQEVFSGFSTNESCEAEGEIELSDSASSISTADVERKHRTRTFTVTEFKGSSYWELDYVRDVLKHADLMLEDFAMGETPKVIIPTFFDQLENQQNGMEKDEEENSKLGQKLLFDCISECVDHACWQIFVGSCKGWVKLRTLFQRKGWLAEELFKEILGWKSMGDLMVDELVDKDMSTQHGKWLEFNIEAFEEGVEIEKGILTYLVDELVSDLLLL